MERSMIMTDHQFDSIIDMVDLILDGCKDLAEAQKKIKSLRRNQRPDESIDADDSESN